MVSRVSIKWRDNARQWHKFFLCMVLCPLDQVFPGHVIGGCEVEAREHAWGYVGEFAVGQAGGLWSDINHGHGVLGVGGVRLLFVFII